MLGFIVLMAVGIYILITLMAGDVRQRVLTTKIGFVRDRHETISTLVDIVEDVLTPPEAPPRPAQPTAEEIRARTVKEFDERSEQSVPRIIHEIEQHAQQDPVAFGHAIRHMIHGIEDEVPAAEPALAPEEEAEEPTADDEPVAAVPAEEVPEPQQKAS